MEVYLIGLTLILVLLAVALILISRRKREENLENILENIENNIISIKRSLEEISYILKTDENVETKKKHARKRSV